MAITAAMWVHGNTVQAENPGPHLNETRYGWGTCFRSEKFPQWFHFAITTPVILNNKRPVLKKVFVLFVSEGSARITEVHIYDGAKRVKSFTGLQSDGDHGKTGDSKNSWEIDPPLTIRYGLGLSIQVSYGVLGATLPAITFNSAGADFE